MNKLGPILIIEDDVDDRMLFEMALRELHFKNELVFFQDGDAAFEFLKTSTVIPFLIISDINLPKVNGLELRRRIQLDPVVSEKCIPYIFFSTSVAQSTVQHAYLMSVQGFFKKGGDYDAIKDDLNAVIQYWEKCYTPLNFSFRPEETNQQT